MSHLAAIVPAAIASAFAGTTCLSFYFLAVSIHEWTFDPLEALGFLIAGGLAILLAILAASFVTFAYILIFGYPIALVMGERIRHPAGLVFCLVVAFAAALFASMHWFGSISDGELPTIGGVATIMSFALPAGYLYRRFVISMLDEHAEPTDY